MIPPGIHRFFKKVSAPKPSENQSEEFKKLMRLHKNDLFALACEHDCIIPPGATKKKLTKLIIDKKTLDTE